MTTEVQHPEDSDWSACPSGEIQGLVGRLQARQRRERTRQAAAGVVCLALLVTAGFYAVPRLGVKEAKFGGITCSELQQQAEQYVQQTLDPQATERFDAHLARCRHCREFISEFQADSLSQPDQKQTGTVSERQHGAPPILVAGNLD